VLGALALGELLMNLSRRALLLGAPLVLLAPRRLHAQPAVEREHRPVIDTPTLAEDPSAVPLHVSVNHPMEPEHFIRSIEIRLDQDPVPYKGKFLFTPANGQAAVAFHMRSGAGGLLKVTAECSRHGHFVSTKETRVTEGGCAGPPEMTRDRLGNPRVRLPETIRNGDLVQVRAKVDHNSYTGLVLKSGKYVREAPEFYIKQMLVLLDDQKISDFQLTSAVSANPLIRFPLKATRSGTLRVVFTNNEGHCWEATQRIQV
jgi:desulfoferrodoxin (superoxide reductase-like protein)